MEAESTGIAGSSKRSTLWILDIKKNQELLYVKKVLWSIILIDW